MSDDQDVPPKPDSQPQGVPAGLSRRRFLKSMGASSAAVAGGALNPVQAVGATTSTARDATSPDTASEDDLDRHPVALTVNGTLHHLHVAPNAILLDVLRDSLNLTGTKKGCDHGQCGACTLHVNGVAVNSCLSLAVMHDGDAVTTVEGLGTSEHLHPIQQAFWEHDAYQCGYCTAGQMMSAVAVICDRRIASDDHALREAMSGNICRCGAYKNITAAIQNTRTKLRSAS